MVLAAEARFVAGEGRYAFAGAGLGIEGERGTNIVADFFELLFKLSRCALLSRSKVRLSIAQARR
jgi:hypothetical protein